MYNPLSKVLIIILSLDINRNRFCHFVKYQKELKSFYCVGFVDLKCDINIREKAGGLTPIMLCILNPVNRIVDIHGIVENPDNIYKQLNIPSKVTIQSDKGKIEKILDKNEEGNKYTLIEAHLEIYKSIYYL